MGQNTRICPVSDYTDLSLLGQYKGIPFVAIRRFTQGGTPYYLAYNLHTWETKRIKTAEFSSAQHSESVPECPTSEDATSWVPKNALILTVDLCPSPKPFDKEILTQIPAWIPRPVPIGIAISGDWITRHPEDLEWLKAEEAHGHVQITWINHSNTHPYKPHVPNDQTFLLTPGISLRDEALQTEIKMLEHGLVPSVFFRCPGLISSPEILAFLHQLHLISIGATAWLAKGQPAKPGSIILVHGNGNEPKGIQLLLSWYAELNPKTSTKWLSLESIVPK